MLGADLQVQPGPRAAHRCARHRAPADRDAARSREARPFTRATQRDLVDGIPCRLRPAVSGRAPCRAMPSPRSGRRGRFRAAGRDAFRFTRPVTVAVRDDLGAGRHGVTRGEIAASRRAMSLPRSPALARRRGRRATRSGSSRAAGAQLASANGGVRARALGVASRNASAVGAGSSGTGADAGAGAVGTDARARHGQARRSARRRAARRAARHAGVASVDGGVARRGSHQGREARGSAPERSDSRSRRCKRQTPSPAAIDRPAPPRGDAP